MLLSDDSAHAFAACSEAHNSMRSSESCSV
jgi:hypothetical protein